MSLQKNSTFSVVRLDYSAYQAEDFPARERKTFSELNLNYCHYPEKVPRGELILISNSHSNLEAIPEEVWRRTRLLLHPNSGYDNIPMRLLRDYSFPVIVGNPIRAQAVANYVVGQIYRHFNSPPFCREWHSKRKWPRRLTQELKVLLIGMGHVGSLVYKALAPAVKKIICYDPFKGHLLDDLIEQAGQCHIILPLCSLNATSQYMIDSAFLMALPQDFILINGARGKLIRQKALIEVLNQRPMAFAYLDVFEREPFSPQDFADLKNANLKSSGHVAGVYDGLDDAILKFNFSVCRDFVQSQSVCLYKYRDLVLQHRLIKGVLI